MDNLSRDLQLKFYFTRIVQNFKRSTVVCSKGRSSTIVYEQIDDSTSAQDVSIQSNVEMDLTEDGHHKTCPIDETVAQWIHETNPTTKHTPMEKNGTWILRK